MRAAPQESAFASLRPFLELALKSGQDLAIRSDLDIVDRSSDSAYWDSIERIVEKVRAAGAGPDGVTLLAGLSQTHPEWPVRAAAVRLLGQLHASTPVAAEAIAAATHDEVDWVAFTAIKVIGENRIGSAVTDLIKISGWPSNFTKPKFARKPVGCGAAFTKRALLAIFGSSDPAALRMLEDEHFAEMRTQIDAARRARVHDEVVLVPGGPFIAGATVKEVGPFQMDDSDNALRVVELPSFYIDRTTVTNERYQKFLDDIGESIDFDHPDQEPGRSHIPAHLHDPRFNRPEQPVVGIDWYDAWAYATWAGGALPSEDQWEKAARGTDGRVFPWGNSWEPERVNYVERVYGRKVENLQQLEELLVTTQHEDFPANPVMPADSLPEGASTYGLLHMSGNVWELTRTNFYTREDMDPFFRGRRPVEFMNRKDAFHVLRGGTWTSPSACLTTYYRGKDLLTDKHNEVGFRCVYPADGD
jgi:gamma-glutamyl hercynylcysteine S-oxide synthase